MEEGGLAEADRTRDLAQADARKAALCKERLGDVENLLAGARGFERPALPAVGLVGERSQAEPPLPESQSFERRPSRADRSVG